MGNHFARFRKMFSSQKEQQIAMVGLDSAGKTTILYRMLCKDHVDTIPTIGFNSESFVVNKTKFNTWDLGGQDDIRSLWVDYVKDSNGLVFVVDIMDDRRWAEAAKELKKINDYFDGNAILILANKADDPNDPALRERMEGLTRVLQLDMMGAAEICVEHVSATHEGYDNYGRLIKGFEWLAKAVDK